MAHTQTKISENHDTDNNNCLIFIFDFCLKIFIKDITEIPTLSAIKNSKINMYVTYALQTNVSLFHNLGFLHRNLSF